jgi:hypothetical protein
MLAIPSPRQMLSYLCQALLKSTKVFIMLAQAVWNLLQAPPPNNLIETPAALAGGGEASGILVPDHVRIIFYGKKSGTPIFFPGRNATQAPLPSYFWIYTRDDDQNGVYTHYQKCKTTYAYSPIFDTESCFVLLRQEQMEQGQLGEHITKREKYTQNERPTDIALKPFFHVSKNGKRKPVWVKTLGGVHEYHEWTEPWAAAVIEP